jgi:hypothetical protein
MWVNKPPHKWVIALFLFFYHFSVQSQVRKLLVLKKTFPQLVSTYYSHNLSGNNNECQNVRSSIRAAHLGSDARYTWGFHVCGLAPKIFPINFCYHITRNI